MAKRHVIRDKYGREIGSVTESVEDQIIGSLDSGFGGLVVFIVLAALVLMGILAGVGKVCSLAAETLNPPNYGFPAVEDLSVIPSADLHFERVTVNHVAIEIARETGSFATNPVHFEDPYSVRYQVFVRNPDSLPHTVVAEVDIGVQNGSGPGKCKAVAETLFDPVTIPPGATRLVEFAHQYNLATDSCVTSGGAGTPQTAKIWMVDGKY